eukprot:1822688-Pyramimonas_sp.AAC.1
MDITGECHRSENPSGVSSRSDCSMGARRSEIQQITDFSRATIVASGVRSVQAGGARLRDGPAVPEGVPMGLLAERHDDQAPVRPSAGHKVGGGR